MRGRLSALAGAVQCLSCLEHHHIGDGANDLPMIKAAGLGIAYHAKPKVNEKTEVTIRHADLMGVFCILSGSLKQK